jgi:hypothetical protein
MRILAIDGGGVRGVVPAATLAAWADDIGLNAHTRFDLFAGTSTGAIVASAIACGRSAAEVLSLFLEHAPAIFSREGLAFTQRALSFKGWAVPAYSDQALRATLDQALGDITLGECPRPLVIPSLDVVTGGIRIFRSHHLPNGQGDRDIRVVDAVLASTAAPTFFPSAQVDGSSYVDGALWANNPSMLALLEARDMSESPDTVRMLSLGCGKPLWGKPVGFGVNRGFLGWGTPLMSLSMSAQSEGVHSCVRRLIPKDGYLRVDPQIPRDLIALDAPGNMPSLIARANETARENREQVNSLLR